MAHEHVRAFAPGRVNLIGEHTDYNGGLALPFAIAAGVVVRATATGEGRILAWALGGGEEDEFALPEEDESALPTPEETAPAGPARTQGWRALVRGVVCELSRAGFPLVGARLEIGGDLPQGSGLSSSAALEVALCLALLALGGTTDIERTSLARLCSRVEHEWAGARTGLLDQLASLYGAADTALLIDFRALTIDPVPLLLPDDWRLVLLDSGERHLNASSRYNERRAECERACALLGVESLREANREAVEGLPEPWRSRARHVLDENARVRDTVAALHAEDLPAVGHLLNAAHASLRDQFEVSTPAVEATVQRLLGVGAAGARLVGGGFGGHVLGLLASGVRAPADARAVSVSAGARLLDPRAAG